jgi:hypothetical protein
MVYASSVLEAAAAELKQIRETEMIEDEGVFDLTVDLITTTSHKVSLSKLKAWLESSGHDPREAALKTKLRYRLMSTIIGSGRTRDRTTSGIVDPMQIESSTTRTRRGSDKWVIE